MNAVAKIFIAFFDLIKEIFVWSMKLGALMLILFTIVYLYMGGNIWKDIVVTTIKYQIGVIW